MKHLQWFNDTKLAAVRACKTFEECREKGLHLEINMNGAPRYNNPAEFAELVLPTEWLENLRATSTDQTWMLHDDGSSHRTHGAIAPQTRDAVHE